MILYLLKSGACLIVLFGVYKFFLEKEKMLHFNRYFLLFSLIFSFSIPLISIEIGQENLQIEKVNKLISTENIPFSIPNENPVNEVQKTDYQSFIKYIYIIVTFFQLLKFTRNLVLIKKKITQNRKIIVEGIYFILLKEKVELCTFLNYIFINEEEYNNLEDELISHERTHIQQFHTLDILFIEILRIIFWFNPTLNFYKKAIQLNHEFMADETVNQKFQNIRFYQELLLQKSIGNLAFNLTSNLTFQITKQRLLMMTTHTSAKVALLKKVVLLPIFTILLLSFIDISFAQTPTKPLEIQVIPNENSKKKLTQKDVNMDNARVYIFEDLNPTTHEKGKIKNPKNYNELTDDEKKLLKESPLYAEKNNPTDEMMKLWASTDKYGVWVDSKRIPNNKLNSYKASDIAEFSISRLYKNAQVGNRRFQIDLMTHKYYDEVYMKHVKESPMFSIDKRTNKNKPKKS
ncbi:M56 family metallopeptidase [Emticicia sp. SJ17W-69]|uniref:M56 family metallopeptidase n=1 Tax=Emticicia sp. SJ17W-69 TaxID=3421657 RepID=UPI003EBF1DDD